MNCNGKIINLHSPVVMGILNATPDSFYNKGRMSTLDHLMDRAIQMIGEGATILDIGGQSTRPNAVMISEKEELKRVIPLIQSIHSKFPSTVLSIDTFHSEVAQQAVEAGADIINDISGSEIDPKIIDIATKYKVPYICMHMQGTPQTMQVSPHYDDVCADIYNYFKNKLNLFSQRGLQNIVIDVGFGFGKTLEHNYTLLANLCSFKSLGKPILVGLSRKSMVYKPIHSNAEHALNGTSILHILALQNGANILRAHDVKEAIECITLYKKTEKYRKIDSSN